MTRQFIAKMFGEVHNFYAISDGVTLDGIHSSRQLRVLQYMTRNLWYTAPGFMKGKDN